MIKVGKMTTHEARRLVQDGFVQVTAEQETCAGFVPSTNEPEFEIYEQCVLTEDRITEQQTQIGGDHFDPDILHRFRDIEIRQGYSPHMLPEAHLRV